MLLQDHEVGFGRELQKQFAKSQVIERLGFLSHQLGHFENRRWESKYC